MKYTDLLVDTDNPDGLDQVVQQMGGVLVGGGTPLGYERVDGHYVLRVFGDAGFVRFALKHQGYATVIGERDCDLEKTRKLCVNERKSKIEQRIACDSSGVITNISDKRF